MRNFESLRKLPKNVWAVSLTSFFMDISSEMVTNILPLFLANVLGVQPTLIGLIEGVAESTASLLKIFSGWISDRLKSRKWLAVIGYGFSALSKPFYLLASSWGFVAAIRWSDRVGKGIRTAPRDALIADSIRAEQRGLAFGLHRAMDTFGALIGIIIAAVVINSLQGSSMEMTGQTFHIVVLFSLLPAFLAVITLAFGAAEVALLKKDKPDLKPWKLGGKFTQFLIIVGVFTLGNSSDAFLILRAQKSGLDVISILAMLAMFNLIYSVISMPAGSLSDKIGRKKLIIGGWVVYAVIYFGFALSSNPSQMFTLYALYGIYYGLAHGTANALIADLIPSQSRGTAYGTYNAVVGLTTLPASLIAGWLWEVANFSAPFWFGGGMALIAAVMLFFFKIPNPDEINPIPEPGI